MSRDNINRVEDATEIISGLVDAVHELADGLDCPEIEEQINLDEVLEKATAFLKENQLPDQKSFGQ